MQPLATPSPAVCVCDCLSELYCDCLWIYYRDELTQNSRVQLPRERRERQTFFLQLPHCGWLENSKSCFFFCLFVFYDAPPWTKCSLHKTSAVEVFPSMEKSGSNDVLLLPATLESLALESLPLKLSLFNLPLKPDLKAPWRLHSLYQDKHCHPPGLNITHKNVQPCSC